MVPVKEAVERGIRVLDQYTFQTSVKAIRWTGMIQIMSTILANVAFYFSYDIVFP